MKRRTVRLTFFLILSMSVYIYVLFVSKTIYVNKRISKVVSKIKNGKKEEKLYTKYYKGGNIQAIGPSNLAIDHRYRIIENYISLSSYLVQEEEELMKSGRATISTQQSFQCEYLDKKNNVKILEHKFFLISGLVKYSL